MYTVFAPSGSGSAGKVGKADNVVETANKHADEVEDAAHNTSSFAKNSSDSPREFVRRFDSKAKIKKARKNGIAFDPEKGHGIPTTTTQIDPVNPDKIIDMTGAKSADAYIDIDVTGKKTNRLTTKAGHIEIRVLEDIKPEDIVHHGRVRKSKRSPED